MGFSREALGLQERGRWMSTAQGDAPGAGRQGGPNNKGRSRGAKATRPKHQQQQQQQQQKKVKATAKSEADLDGLEALLAQHKCGNLLQVFRENGFGSLEVARKLSRKDLEDKLGLSKGLSIKLSKLLRGESAEAAVDAGAGASKDHAPKNSPVKRSEKKRKADTKPAIIAAFVKKLQEHGVGKFKSLSIKQLELDAADFLEPSQLEQVQCVGGIVAFCETAFELYVNEKRATISINNNGKDSTS